MESSGRQYSECRRKRCCNSSWSRNRKGICNYKLGNTSYNTYLEVTVEKVETECTISLNGTQYTGNSLQEIVEQSKLTELTSVKFESGVIRDTDFDYLEKFSRIKWTLKEFRIGDDVELRGLAGNAIPLMLLCIVSGI